MVFHFRCAFFLQLRLIAKVRSNLNRKRFLIPNPLQVFEQNLLTAAVIEFRGPAVGMAGDPLSGFKRAVIFQKIRDAGRPE